ncbi:hypothetical protein LR48_Vigan05g118000 [Vigna angularis]|uniref:Uncharacterized protein n=1 Tax=Phaseolus angularis TaxID=3914 RepID=A0A0L9UL14_PHAAN|nr:hypothetical protein LR48_Vigan05g118000 [Vigna angularis]
MEPWEQLDIDESDLDSFIRRCNSNNSVIPDLVGVIEAAMVNRQVNENIPTQEFLSDIAKASFDRDFTSNAWVWAEKFIDIHGFWSDIGCPTDDLVRLSIPIVTNKPPTRSIDDILTKLIPPLHNDKTEGSRSNKNNKNATNWRLS